MCCLCSEIFQERLSNTWIGKLQPEKAKEIANIIAESRTKGTYRHLISQFRQWVIYCDDFSIDPLAMPPDPYLYMFWIQERIDASGSIASLDSWTALMHWLCEIQGAETTYKTNNDVRCYFKAIRKIYTKGKDQRLPFKLAHILKYVKSLKRVKKNQTKMDYDDLVKMTICQTFFFTMSRPCELLKTTRADGKTRGLPLKNIKWLKDKENNLNMIELEITSYKNQASKLISKKVWMADTTCTSGRHKTLNKKGEKCPCRYLNPAVFINIMLKERKKLIKKLKIESQEIKTCKKRKKRIQKILTTLEVNPQNSLFVFKNGKIANTTDLRKIAKEICKANKIMDDHHYTAYSFRIGGTTLASLRNIDHPKILKYVGWASSRLADCAQRYMRYPPSALAIIPLQMIHGHKDPEYLGVPKTTGKIYDPWSEQTNFKFYQN